MKTENAPTHTPGPWNVAESHAGSILITAEHPRGVDQDVAKIYIPETGDMKANGRLIAAAPDLLAVCRAVQAKYDSGRSIAESLLPFLAAGELKRAIAKAEG